MRVADVRAWAVRIPGPGQGLTAAAGLGDPTNPARPTGYRIAPPYRTLFSDNLETTIVRVTTDAGIIGVGEAQAPVGPEVSAAIVNNLLGPLVVGTNPADVDVTWHKLYDAMRDRGHTGGFYLDAISAIDIALWDILGQSHGVPIHRLLGGRFRDRVPLYVSGIGGPTQSDRLHAAERYLERGFRAIKLFIGHDRSVDLAEVRAFRDAVGPDITLLADGHWQYDRPTALQIGRALEQLDYGWFEAPILAEDLAGYAELAAALTIPIAEGETKRSRHELLPFLERRALDIVQPDVGRAGGISECRRIAMLADTFHLPYAPHLGLSLGIYVAASLQLAAATPNFRIFEWQPTMQERANQLLTHPFLPEDGHFAVSDRPGLGTTINWDALEPYLIR